MPITAVTANADSAKTQRGLNAGARAEISAAGGDKYLGTSISRKSDFGAWTKHTFDRQYVPDSSYPSGQRPDGPACITGDEYAVYTKAGDPDKLLIFLQGGGACWGLFYNCNLLAEDQAPPQQPPFPGVFDSGDPGNPFADYSVVYMPYCDGSAFSGDNDVNDASWQAHVEGSLGLPPGTGPETRYHRGVQNQSAGMDVAAEMFPRARQVTVMGHSAGGVGVAGFTPFLARFAFGNKVKLTAFNDAGPIAINLGTGNPPGNGQFPYDCTDITCIAVVSRALDWQFAKFYPKSCVDDGRCNAFGQQTGIIDWRLENDATLREAFYETDSDATNRFFAQGDGSRMDPEAYRELLLSEHGALNEAHPKRYKVFIVSGDDTHGAVQGAAASPCFESQPDLFYKQEANGVLLSEWSSEFIRIGGRQSKFGWKNVVEDYLGPTICSP
jgi:hypothetical protein